MTRSAEFSRLRPILVTGGAGFIGCNLADRLARNGHHVVVFDALTRRGVEENLAWLCRRHPDRITAIIADIRDRDAVEAAIADVQVVFHFAAQVAVTTSLVDPADDFSINLQGTHNLLEAARLRRPGPPPVIFASTNKVYGDLADIELESDGTAWLPIDRELRRHGVGESRPLEFHTPYGCSKGAADQYVLDYARSFEVPSAVLRMSCIYGGRQQGTEDQGWVAHFMLRALAGLPITVFGDGRQVRDILYVDDAVEAYLRAWAEIDRIDGRAFNLGGGPRNAVSLLQVIGAIEEAAGRKVTLGFETWRPGDQRYFVADTRRITEALRLPEPISWRRGLTRLAEALTEARGASAPSAEAVA